VPLLGDQHEMTVTTGNIWLKFQRKLFGHPIKILYFSYIAALGNPTI
jgi:hypothetical protein